MRNTRKMKTVDFYFFKTLKILSKIRSFLDNSKFVSFKLLSVDRQVAIGTGGARAVVGHLGAVVTFHEDASNVQVVFSTAIVTRGNAVGGDIQRIAFHRDGVGVEAVGTFAVVGIESFSQGAVAYDDAIVHADPEGSPSVYCIKDRLGGSSSLVALKIEILCSRFKDNRHCGKDIGIGGHGGSQCSILMD